MSLKSLVVISAVSSLNNNKNNNMNATNRNYLDYINYPNSGYHQHHHSNTNRNNGNVNILLGGAMLSVVLTILFLVWYCCYRSIQKRTIYHRRWMENDPNLEIYTIEQTYDSPRLYADCDVTSVRNNLRNPPPPSYEAVLAMDAYMKRQSIASTSQLLLQSQCDDHHHHHLHHHHQNIMIEPEDTVLEEDLDLTNIDIQSDDEMEIRNTDYNGNRRLSDQMHSLHSQTDLINNNNNNNDLNVNTNRPDEDNNQIESITRTSLTPSDQEANVNNNNVIDSSDITVNSALVLNDTNVTEQNNNTDCDLDTLNENGLVRMDMSRIIDKTGLPTYEAALKLESSGYV